MQRTVILVLVLVVTFVRSQTSTNPTGADFFSPSLVRELPLNNVPVSSVIPASPSNYAEFYWGYVPQNVGAISITLNVTNSCGNSIHALINFVQPVFDPSFSFPCPDGEDSSFCSQQDDSFTAVADGPAVTYEPIAPYIRPGKNFYITLYQYSTPVENCSYTIQAKSTFNCSNDNAILVWGETFYCTNYSTATTNGQTFTGASFTSTASVYKVDVPKNVSLAYAWLTSQDNNLYLMSSAGFAPLSTYAADRYTNEFGTLGSNNSLYTYYLDITLPDGDYPLFFAVRASSANGIPFNLSLHWEACGAAKFGYGTFSPEYTNASLTFYKPACQSSVQFPDLKIASTQNFTFQVPPWNNTFQTYGASYGFLEIPFGTYGAVNLTCASDNPDNTFIVYSKSQNSDCSAGYMGALYCDGIVNWLSQDLYSGGYWTFAACNRDNATSSSITLLVSSSATVPSASPGVTTGQDNSAESMAPALVLIALAVFIQL